MTLVAVWVFLHTQTHYQFTAEQKLFKTFSTFFFFSEVSVLHPTSEKDRTPPLYLILCFALTPTNLGSTLLLSLSTCYISIWTFYFVIHVSPHMFFILLSDPRVLHPVLVNALIPHLYLILSRPGLKQLLDATRLLQSCLSDVKFNFIFCHLYFTLLSFRCRSNLSSQPDSLSAKT